MLSVKIGYWRSNPQDLISRYTTTYGHSLQIFCFEMEDCRAAEKTIFSQFAHYRLDKSELFQKDNVDEYLSFAKGMSGKDGFLLLHQDNKEYTSTLTEAEPRNTSIVNNYNNTTNYN